MERINWLARTNVRPGRYHWRKRWEIVRQAGWGRYVLVDHALICGVSLFVVSRLSTLLFHPRLPPSGVYPSLRGTLIFVGSWGALGAVKWWNCERHYRRPENPPKESAP